MDKYDYKEEANKLKAKRNFGFNFIESSEIDRREKELNSFCNNNLQLYRQRINEILDKVEKEKEKIKNETYLLFFYQFYLQERIERRKTGYHLDPVLNPEIMNLDVVQQIFKKYNP